MHVLLGDSTANGMFHAVQGIWAKALGFGDFYYELGVQVRHGEELATPWVGALPIQVPRRLLCAWDNEVL